MKKVIDGKIVESVITQDHPKGVIINDIKRIVESNINQSAETYTLAVSRRGNVITIDQTITNASSFDEGDFGSIKKHIEIVTNGLASSSVVMSSIIESINVNAHILQDFNDGSTSSFVELGNDEGNGDIIDFNGNLDPRVGLTDTITNNYGSD